MTQDIVITENYWHFSQPMPSLYMLPTKIADKCAHRTHTHVAFHSCCNTVLGGFVSIELLWFPMSGEQKGASEWKIPWNANDSAAKVTAAATAAKIASININCSHKNYVDVINVIVFTRPTQPELHTESDSTWLYILFIVLKAPKI